MSIHEWIELAGKPYRDAIQREASGDPRAAMTDDLESALYAQIAELKAQVAELTADAIIRAHRQCVAMQALLTIRNSPALLPETRQIAARALAEIEQVQP